MFARPTRWLICALGVFLGLAGLALSVQPDNKMVLLNEKDDGKKIKLVKGEKLVLKLKMLGSAGYTWSVVKNDTKVLKQLGEPETEKGGGGIGAAVTRVYRFEGAAAGKSELELEYKRPFEKDKKPAKVFKVTVEVE